VKNTSIPESTLTKKHNAINYHIIRESAAMGMIRVGSGFIDKDLESTQMREIIEFNHVLR
jgi:hypothetical protein